MIRSRPSCTQRYKTKKSSKNWPEVTRSASYTRKRRRFTPLRRMATTRRGETVRHRQKVDLKPNGNSKIVLGHKYYMLTATCLSLTCMEIPGCKLSCTIWYRFSWSDARKNCVLSMQLSFGLDIGPILYSVKIPSDLYEPDSPHSAERASSARFTAASSVSIQDTGRQVLGSTSHLTGGELKDPVGS
ncbi:hypothetical protein LZ32DRAFT_272828 [Colletotrichum eremochloae]|nr:hypothetical protein LZ32DRAFT_272828 [Colletotrichum eremochloae]